MLLVASFLLLAIGYLASVSTNIDSAVAKLIASTNYNGINGLVQFEQKVDHVLITVRVYGLTDGKHGFHIHQTGNINHDCSAAGGHYNPSNVNHGGLVGGHAGDLGNIISYDGRCIEKIRTNKFRLADILNRTIVIHAGEDDLGLGGDAESLKTGNSGARVACGIIKGRSPLNPTR